MGDFIGVKYTSASMDCSGYASASRGYISSLIDYHPEINLTINNVSFEPQKTTHDSYKQKAEPFFNKKTDYR